MNFDELMKARPVCPCQIHDELKSLCEMVEKISPRTILEIGVEQAGSAYFFHHLLSPNNGTYIGIDIEPESKRRANYLTDLIPNVKSIVLVEDSRKKETEDLVSKILNGVGLDFLFIDGFHSYEVAKSDYLLYSGFVRPGGIIAFHDILPRGVGSGLVWKELKDEDSVEIIRSDTGWYGIGVITKQ